MRASIFGLANTRTDNVGRKISTCTFDAGAVGLGSVASAAIACIDVEGVGGGHCGDCSQEAAESLDEFHDSAVEARSAGLGRNGWAFSTLAV